MDLKYEANVPEELKDLIPQFLKNRENDIVELKKQIEAKDLEVLTRIGHTLKGACGGYGFDELGFIGKEIEFAAKDSNMEKVTEMTNLLESYLTKVTINYVED